MFRKTCQDMRSINNAMHSLRQNLAASTAADANIELPAPQGLSYLPYQRAGISFGLKNLGVLIADEPGLGKTIQAIGIINADPRVRHILVVCPASLKTNWARELNKWLVIPRKTVVIEGSNCLSTAFGAEVVIINYELVPVYIDAILAYSWDMIIADECHVLRNIDAKRTQHIVGVNCATENALVPIPARRKVFLTGTPILNRVKDIWTLVSYLNPTIWRSYEEFVSKYCKKSDGATGAVDSGSSNLEQLQAMLRSTVMIRRLKKDVLSQLPPKQRAIVKLTHCSSELASLLQREQQMFASMRASIHEDAWDFYAQGINSMRPADKYLFEETSRIRHEIALLKTPLIIKYLEQELAKHHKIVVFAHHQDVIEQITRHFKDIAVSFTGKSSAKLKQQAIDRFQNDSGIRLCVASILSAGVGITLTAASRVIFAELDWTAANVTQAEDRCHRIGQRYSVEVVHLILEGSIDINIAQKIIIKQRIYEQALN